MFMIKKRSGVKEEFSTEKIKKSMQKAGVDQKMAKNLAVAIRHRENITTEDVQAQVMSKLQKLKNGTAERFSGHQKNRSHKLKAS